MKQIAKISVLILFSAFMLKGLFAQQFYRAYEVPLPDDQSSFGNMVTGVDFDGDGKKEIYAVNNDWSDNGAELIPTIYKFEANGVGWDMVWSTKLDIPLQNTWPAMTYGDWDGDGKMEIIWGPVNNTNATSNPNPARIVVFETKGDGSDVMGVQDPNDPTMYKPNAEWTMVTEDMANERPFRWELNDFNNDGQQELVMCLRAGSMRYAVVSVDNIPDNGDGSETWTLDASDATTGAVSVSTTYDMAIMNNTLLLLGNAGDIQTISYDNGTYTVNPLQEGVFGGSWNSAQVVDLDGDGTQECIVGSWSSSDQNVYLLQGSGPNITATPIADLSSLIGSGRIYGGCSGDLDGNGKLDFAFGSRDASPNAAITRLEYLGGDITSTDSYSASIIDQGFQDAGGRWMTLTMTNLDTDPNLEVAYTEGTGEKAPIVILKYANEVPVELTSFAASVGNNEVTLKWSTATETNNKGFEVQRKSASSNYATIGYVDGNGTSTEKHSYTFVDRNLNNGKYTYRLKQTDLDGTYKYSDEVNVDLTAPLTFSLDQNYPNPFNPSTNIKFTLAKTSNVTLKVYNLVGQEVASIINNELKDAGSYNVTFDASNLASGTYIYVLNTGEKSFSKKMTLLK